MSRSPARKAWKPRLAGAAGPMYRAIADALELDVREGRLGVGDPLPTQRQLADAIGVNFTTVTRAYAEARRRGLISARVGQGTFVAGAGRAAVVDDDDDFDLSVNAPPTPDWMPEALRATLERLAGDAGLQHRMLTYASRHGDLLGVDAGVTWLRARGIAADPSCVAVTSGAQHALSTLLRVHARPGDTVLIESLSYPGMQAPATAVGVQLIGVDIDNEGIMPDALEAACRLHAPVALFCVPTFQNPTTAVMSTARREAILEVARKYGLRVVEDDICGPLLRERPPLLAALAPDIVTYVGSLSKCVAPGLRTAFIHTPTADEAARVQAGVRASILMLSPLSTAVAAAWIADGTAERAVRDISAETTARGVIARRVFGEDQIRVPAGSLHAWLQLPPMWSLAGFVAQAQQRGVRVAPADWYVAPTARLDGVRATPNAVRVTLGVARDRARFTEALQRLAGVLRQAPALRASNL
ncbi:MAG TPA: PLP-dependent aminotransferase family protein [Gemmatimonadaceae bacterium]